MEIRRGDLFLANLNHVVGSKQESVHSVVVIQGDILNKHSSTVIVALVTPKLFSEEFPNQVFIERGNFGLKLDSTILLDQIRVIDKKRILKKLGRLDLGTMRRVDLAIGISLRS